MKCANELCNNTFEPKTKNQLYCSRICQNRQSARRFKRNNKSTCEICNATIDIRYKKCRSCSLRYEKVDWNNVTLKDLTDRRNYQINSQIRELARQKYRNENIFNDSAYKCSVCDYDGHIEICHIKAISDYNENSKISEINDISNLIALCPNHHWELDNNHILIKITL